MKYDNASLVQIPSGYKASTLYSVLPQNGNGDFDFTRGSTATRVNENGLIESVGSNVPRLDYPLLNGVVQDCPALLLEPSRTNLITYSEALSNWGQHLGSTLDNQATSPDGSVNASIFTVSSAASGQGINKTFTADGTSNYTVSGFIKKSTESIDISVRIRQAFASGTLAALVNFNTNTGIINTITGSASVEAFNTNWWYVTLISTTPPIVGTQNAIIRLDNYAIGTEITAWGFQVEAGSYATSYIPTSGTTVTRSADVCNGAGTSAEFNDSEGVLFAEISALANDLTFRTISINNNSTSEAVRLRFNTSTNQIQGLIRDGGSAVATMSIDVNDITTYNKAAYKYKTGDLAIWINGFEMDNSTAAISLSGLANLDFEEGAGNNDFYGKTKQLATFNVALSDTQLEDLTSWDSFAEMAQSQEYITE